MAVASFVMNAQDKNQDLSSYRKDMKTKMTTEQRADLKTKRLSLKLNLNSSQQEKIRELYVEMEKSRAKLHQNSNLKADPDRYKTKSDRLDRRMAIKKQLREILDEEQLIKLETLHNERLNKRKLRNASKNGDDKVGG